MFAERSQGQWKMVYYVGLPHFTADDVLWSIGSPAEPSQEVPQVSAPVCKTVLPIGITVIVRNTGRLIGITVILTDLIKFDRFIFLLATDLLHSNRYN